MRFSPLASIACPRSRRACCRRPPWSARTFQWSFCSRSPASTAESLHELLAELQAAEFLYQSRLLPEPQYTFKHALTHRVAYESVLKERRRAVHVQLIEIIEALYADRLDEHVELLAHHALAGGQWPRAVQYLLSVGKQSDPTLSAPAGDPVPEQGLEIIATLPESPERLRQELDYQKAMGVAMMAAKGWAAKEVLDAYTRARVLCEAAGRRARAVHRAAR